MRSQFASKQRMAKHVSCVLILALLISACSQDRRASSAPQATGTEASQNSETAAPLQVELALVEAPALVEIRMFDERNGWGVSEIHIVRTNDGGVTWYNATPPEVDETGFGVDLFALDASHAWMQKPDFENYPNSGVLHRTTDGGVTWKNNAVPFSRGDIYFLDAENGWVLADLGIGAGSNAVAVYQTTNGGVTWEQTYTNDPNQPEAQDSLPLSGIKSDIVPLSMRTAWVSGVIYAPGEVYLYRTDDGGRSWSAVSLVLPEGAQTFELGIDEDQLKLASSRDGFIALRMSHESTQTALYVTHDSGDTWTLMPTTINGAGETEFLSQKEAILYDGEQFYVTRDAAATWVTVSPDLVFGETFAGMEFVDTLSGWVITLDPTTNHRTLYRTTDGGATWFPVIP